ncbi:glycosyltransferase [Marinilabilia salmonicolor]|uniref:Glycosyl transferase family 2 n=1 Tax=Marinilabilia salmonicolor TaxID=989 RepID=A0A368UT55_9BACT|nr:glycosyltransferase [Marinilabilia salmonicolor]RCW30041.1 glycosyl transferase family 2 [Marinilabilia salmonicolor]
MTLHSNIQERKNEEIYKPAISVIMAVFSEPLSLLQESIQSILEQTFEDFEFIIVNDNPLRGDLMRFLDNYKKSDDRIVILNNKKNKGLTQCLNVALKSSRGRYIARMDADDISLKMRLFLQFNFLELNEDIDLCGSFVYLLNGTKTKKVILPKRPNAISTHLIFNNCIAHGSVMFRRYLFSEKKIAYNEELKKGQDYELWSRFAINSIKMFNYPKGLYVYRQHENQISVGFSVEQNRTAFLVRQKRIECLGLNLTPGEIQVFQKFCLFEKVKQEDLMILDKIISKLYSVKGLDYNELKKQINKRVLYYALKLKKLSIQNRIKTIRKIKFI